jgi:VWFA-related protein
MMTLRWPQFVLSVFFVALLAAATLVSASAQTPTPASNPPAPDPSSSDAGPTTDDGPIILKKKADKPEPPPPPAPDREKIKNPNGATYSLRVDVPLVNLNVNVLLDNTHQFVPGLKPSNFLVLEDGVEQKIDTVRITQTPITAVMLLEFASTSWSNIRDMQQSAIGFFHTLRPDDYVAVITYDLRTHILCDFTNSQSVIANSLQSLMMPGFSDTDMFDALYETLDRTSRIDGRKYIILIGSGRDTFSKLTFDKMLAKIKATPNVTIFSIGTGALSSMGGGGMGMRGGMGRMETLQAQNELKTFATMTGGLYFYPMFLGQVPEIFDQINQSIRNQYVVTYRPTNNKSDGSYRHVQVLLVDNEGHPLRMQDEKQHPVKYSVIARDGYRAKLPVE